MNIIITGASRGIGYQLTIHMSQLGGHNILALSRNLEALDQLRTDCSRFNANEPVSILPCDLTNLPEKAIQEEVEKMGGVDVIIHNAGYLINKPFESLTLEDWQKVYNVNVFGVVQLTQLLLPQLEQSITPHILNISSMGGFQGSSKFPGLSAYSSSKAALSNLTECMAEEFKEKGISVNCLALGAVQTEMLQEAFPGYQAPISASDMASFIGFFALFGQKFFNGKILPVSLSTP